MAQFWGGNYDLGQDPFGGGGGFSDPWGDIFSPSNGGLGGGFGFDLWGGGGGPYYSAGPSAPQPTLGISQTSNPPGPPNVGQRTVSLGGTGTGSLHPLIQQLLGGLGSLNPPRLGLQQDVNALPGQLLNSANLSGQMTNQNQLMQLLMGLLPRST